MIIQPPAVLVFLKTNMQESMRSFPRRKNSTGSLPLYNTDLSSVPSRFHPARLSRLSIFFLLLGIIIVVSLLLNVAHYLPFSSHSIPSNTEAYMNLQLQPPALPAIYDLIIVAGHAVFVGDDINEIGEDEGWVLEDFQKGGQVNTFVEHIKKGVELAIENEKSLLIFSGGQTRPLAGPRSEAQSYWEIAHSLGLWPSSIAQSHSSIFPRAITEEYARDSYENLLFSICRFHELTGRYPRIITVVGFGFKKNRFVELHRKAIKFPLERFEYVGIDDGTLTSTTGEKLNSYGPFMNDLYGCHGSLLEKKLERNPFRRSHGYTQSCPALSALMTYCPVESNEIFPGELPW